MTEQELIQAEEIENRIRETAQWANQEPEQD